MRDRTPTTLSVLDLSSDAYHADGTGHDQPSLSAGIAHTLITNSPRHAWAAHPKLNPDFEREDDDKFSLGTCAHALLLQGEDVAVVCDYPDWRKKDAQAERDAARAAGRVPLLIGQWDRVRAMVAAAREQLDAYGIGLFQNGRPEQTLVWEDEGALCRCRIDWLHDDLSAIDDYKSTAASADPARWVRTMYGIGGDMQVAFYLRGAEKVLGVRPEWRYVVQETYPPYALSVVTLAASALEVGADKVEKALQIWRRCLATGKWPAYPATVERLEIPTYEEMRWLERDAA